MERHISKKTFIWYIISFIIFILILFLCHYYVEHNNSGGVNSVPAIWQFEKT